MFSQLFGAYLVQENLISAEVMDEIIREQVTARPKLGTIAVAAGYLTEEQADEVNLIQTQEDRRFGDIAIEKGYLTEAQLDNVLNQQGNPFMKFLQILTEKNCIPVVEIDTYLNAFQKSRGFSDDDMKALKSEDIDGIVPVFAFAAKPFVTELTAIVLRNITRFVTTNFYIDRIRHVDNYEYKYLAGQRIVGDHLVYIAFAEEKGADGLLTLAKGYAKTDYSAMGYEVFDTVGEFTNICSGLLAASLSEKDIFIDMESPFAYENQHVTGRGYVIPIHLGHHLVELFLSVDDENMKIGETRVEVKIEKKAGSKVTEESKGTVIVVDDSALIRRNLRDLIEREGYTVIAEAVNGAEAVEEYKKYQPDLITLDVTMPVMDGVEALKRIMEFDPKAKSVMVTAAGQQKTIINALKIGAEKFIMKPFSKEEVKSMLHDMIK